MHAKLEIPYRK